MGSVSQHQTTEFLTPVRGGPRDANVVRGNDNTLREALNAHDADPTIHTLTGTLAGRPAAGTAGRVYFSVDAGVVRCFEDNGTNWNEVDYARSTHTHAIADVTDLQTELDGKSDVAHTHTTAAITDFPGNLFPDELTPGAVPIAVSGSDVLADGPIQVSASGAASSAYQPRVKATATGLQTFTGTASALTFSATEYDVGDLWQSSPNPSRLTVPVDGDGLYHFCGSFRGNTASAVLTVAIYKNGVVISTGATRQYPANVASFADNELPSFYIPLVAGDYLQVFVAQTGSGNTTNVAVCLTKVW